MQQPPLQARTKRTAAVAASPALLRGTSASRQHVGMAGIACAAPASWWCCRRREAAAAAAAPPARAAALQHACLRPSESQDEGAMQHGGTGSCCGGHCHGPKSAAGLRLRCGSASSLVHRGRIACNASTTARRLTQELQASIPCCTRLLLHACSCLQARVKRLHRRAAAGAAAHVWPQPPAAGVQPQPQRVRLAGAATVRPWLRACR